MNATDVLILLGSAFGGFLAAFAALVAAVRFLVQPLVAAAVLPIFQEIAVVREKFSAQIAEVEHARTRQADLANALTTHDAKDLAQFDAMANRMERIAEEQRAGFAHVMEKIGEIREDSAVHRLPETKPRKR